MYPGIRIQPPFFEVGPKALLYGNDLLKLAQHADSLSAEYQVQIIFTPQYVDIPLLAHGTHNILVFAQHMDPIKVGRGVGSVLPEALKTAGAVGVLLNHSEKPLAPAVVEKTIARADEVGLATLVCADTLQEAFAIARMSPNIILAEPPELIGAGKRSMEQVRAIQRINSLVREANPEVQVLHAAGISDYQDVYDVIAAGAQGTGSTSGIFLAKDPHRALGDMIWAVRSAWDSRQQSGGPGK
jgi:triosephosphate isomerase